MATYTLTGTGTQALTSGTGSLHVNITAPATGSGDGKAFPVAKYGVGLIRCGDGTAYWDSIPIVGGPQWIGLPVGTTIIGYSIFSGGSVDVTEVAGESPFRGPQGPAGPAGSSGATGPAGASGSTVISTQTLAATAASINLTSIPQTYTHLQLIYAARATSGTGGLELLAQFNGDTGNNYDWQQVRGQGTTNAARNGGAQSSAAIGICASNAMPSGSFGVGIATLPFYTVTSIRKATAGAYGLSLADAALNQQAGTFSGFWRNTSAITSILLLPSTGSFAIGSSFQLIGLA